MVVSGNDMCVYKSTLAVVPLMSSGIRCVNSYGLVIRVFCTCQPSLKHGPLLSAPLPHLASTTFQHQQISLPKSVAKRLLPL